MYLVTGATGLVGSHLVGKLLAEGMPVCALYRSEEKKDNTLQILKYAQLDHLFSKIVWRKADLLDVLELDDVFLDVSHVFHAAATVSFDPKQADGMLHNNVEATRNLVNACLQKNIQKLVHVSSVAALGPAKQNEKITENNAWDPEHEYSVYGLSKYLAEVEVWRASEEGLNSVVLNPSIILGEGCWDHGSGKFFTSAYHNNKFYTHGSSGFVDVQDVVEACYTVMLGEVKNERYIINGENLSYKKVLQEISLALNKSIPSIPANNLMLSIAWRLNGLISSFSGKEPVITKETCRAANESNAFSAEKFMKDFSFTFKPINKSILRVAKHFLSERSIQY